MNEANRKGLESLIVWRFWKEYDKLIELGKVQEVDYNSAITNKFQNYLDGIGFHLNVHFNHANLANPPLQGVQTISTIESSDGAILTVKDGWNYHIVNLLFPDAQQLMNYKENLLSIASIPGVRPYGNADQVMGYSWLKKESRKTSIEFHVDGTTSFILMLNKWYYFKQ